MTEREAQAAALQAERETGYAKEWQEEIDRAGGIDELRLKFKARVSAALADCESFAFAERGSYNATRVEQVDLEVGECAHLQWLADRLEVDLLPEALKQELNQAKHKVNGYLSQALVWGDRDLSMPTTVR